MSRPSRTCVSFAEPPAGAVKPIRAGGSFNEATTLDGSGRYGETIYYGEELYYRVKLDWGQGLAYRVTFGGLPKGATTNIRTALFSPVRADIKSDTTAYTGSTQILPSNGKPIATPRTAYLNRNATDQVVRKASIDGWYYVVVKLGTAFGGDSPGGVPLTLDVAVAGDKAAGPVYGASGDTESTPTPTPTASDSTPSGSKTEAGGKTGDVQPVKDDSPSGLPWIILGVVLVLIVAGGAALLVLRRRKPPAPPTYPNGPGPSWPNQP